MTAGTGDGVPSVVRPSPTSEPRSCAARSWAIAPRRWTPFLLAASRSSTRPSSELRTEAALEALSAKLDDATMQTLNGEVDVHKKAIEDVAKAYLKQTGLL